MGEGERRAGGVGEVISASPLEKRVREVVLQFCEKFLEKGFESLVSSVKVGIHFLIFFITWVV